MFSEGSSTTLFFLGHAEREVAGGGHWCWVSKLVSSLAATTVVETPRRTAVLVRVESRDNEADGRRP